MITHIMAPLDGSELAERALPCAAQLVRLTGATLYLVRVAGPVFATADAVPPPATATDFLAVEMRAAEADLARIRDRLSATGLAVHAERVTGTIAGALLDYERARDIDLVVMCSHGRTGLARFALGSVAERLLRYGEAPLLLARAFGPPATLGRVVVPLDGSSRAEGALRLLDDLSTADADPAIPTIGREVTLLRVVGTPEEGIEAEHYLADIVRQRRNGHVTYASRVEHGDPAQVIIDTAGTDTLVVMATRGRSSAMRWALGSVADRVAHGGAAAVLLVRVGAAGGTPRT